MIYSLDGILLEKRPNIAVIGVGGIGFKVFMSNGAIGKLPAIGDNVKCFSSLYFRDEKPELYGFLEEPELRLFELLTTVNGIGPKTALSVLGVDSVQNITAAILEKRAELLTKTSGIGKKTAERVILELHNKLELPHSLKITKAIDLDSEVEDVLVGLGYTRSEVKRSLQSLGAEFKTFEDRLRQTLKILGRV